MAHPRTYRDYYRDLATDFYTDNEVAQIYARYAPQTAEGAEYANELLEDVFARWDSEPLFFVVLQAEPFRVLTLHRPSTFEAPYMATNTLRSPYTAFTGDVIEGHIPSVYWPDDLFTLTPAIEAHSNDALQTLYRNDEELPTVNNDTSGTTVSTRRAMWIAPRLVHVFLKGPLTPITAWQKVHRRIVDDGAYDAYEPLIDWLRIACTLSSTAENATPANTLNEPLMVPLPAVMSHIEHRTRLLHADLPILAPRPSATVPTVVPTDTTTVVTAIDALRNEHRRAAEAAGTKAPPTASDYYGSAVNILLRMAQVTDQVDLPGVYDRIAQANKKTERLIIQEAAYEQARLIGRGPFAPHISQSLAKNITSVSFALADIDELTENIQPFRCVWTSSEQRQAANELAQAYDTLAGGTSLQLADLDKLKKQEKITFPTTLLHVLYTLKSFGVLLRLLFGENTLVQAYEELITLWDERMLYLETRLRPEHYPHVLRWVQIRVVQWLQQQHHRPEVVTSPNLAILVQNIELLTPWVPPLPAAYQTSTSSITKRNDRGTSNAPPTKPPATSGGDDKERINNVEYDSDFTKFKELGLRLATVREKAKDKELDVPQNDSGTEMCLSYQVLGFCWKRCSRKEDHRVHTAAEKQRLIDWCTRCYREGGPE